jgi:hypothetical protein
MSNKCHFVFLNGNIYLFIFILVKNVFLISMMSNTLILCNKIQEINKKIYSILVNNRLYTPPNEAFMAQICQKFAKQRLF